MIPHYDYIAGYQAKRLEIHAVSLYAAKQAAINFFKPSKKNMGLLWVELVTEQPKANNA